VRLQAIATTYRSTIFKTYAFSLYSHLCNYVSIELPIYTQKLRVIRGAPGDDDQVNTEIHSENVIERVWRCNWGPILRELRDALEGGDRVSMGMHIEAVIA
jgi:hypothetical protein